jgi:hypothetical protein
MNDSKILICDCGAKLKNLDTFRRHQVSISHFKNIALKQIEERKIEEEKNKKGEVSGRWKQWINDNPEKFKECKKKWRDTNKDKVKLYNQKCYDKKNPQAGFYRDLFEKLISKGDDDIYEYKYKGKLIIASYDIDYVKNTIKRDYKYEPKI